MNQVFKISSNVFCVVALLLFPKSGWAPPPDGHPAHPAGHWQQIRPAGGDEPSHPLASKYAPRGSAIFEWVPADEEPAAPAPVSAAPVSDASNINQAFQQLKTLTNQAISALSARPGDDASQLKKVLFQLEMDHLTLKRNLQKIAAKHQQYSAHILSLQGKKQSFTEANQKGERLIERLSARVEECNRLLKEGP